MSKRSVWMISGWIYFCLLACAGTLVAQTAPLNPLRQRPSPAVPMGGGEEEQLTIAKCLADVASEDADRRLRAVMILGKYPRNLRAVQAVENALTDPDPRVRRAAVVSYGEDERMSEGGARKLMARLGDEDVQVRRMVSALLPGIVMNLPREPVRAENGFQTFRPMLLSPKYTSLIAEAFKGSDPVVVRNLLASESLLGSALTPEMLKTLLTGKEAETRALTIAALKKRLADAAWVKAVFPLLEDPAPPVRSAIARTAKNSRDKIMIPLLDKLSRDADIAVAAEAAEGLLLQNKRISEAQLLRLLNAPEMDTPTGERLIRFFPVVSPETRGILLKLSRHQKPAYRAAALGKFSMLRGEFALKTEEILPFMDDPSVDVRRTAQRMLLRIPDLAKLDVVDTYLKSPYEDVRLFLLAVSRIFPEPQSTGILEELLLDESNAVRAQVLAEYARRRLPESTEILTLSLEDENFEIREAAAVGLFRLRTPEAKKALETALAQTRDAQFKRLLLSLVNMLRQSPPNAVRRLPPQRPAIPGEK